MVLMDFFKKIFCVAFFCAMLFFVGNVSYASLENKADAAMGASKFPRAKFEGFERGMGLGGWLTNYKRLNVLADNLKMNLK